jgi:hypothetical protein
MRFSTIAACTLGVAAIVLSAGCSGGNGAGSILTPATGASNAAAQHANAKIPFAYISDSLTSSVNVFGSDGSFQRRIQAGLKNPAGIFVDADHNLWVANAGKGNVLEFARGANKPTITLEDPITEAEPTDVTVCPRGGIYVAGNSAIEVYAPGSSKPSRSLSYPQTQQISAITCDAKGNVFASAVIYFKGAILEFSRGERAGAKVILAPGGGASLRADAAGNLLIGDQSAATIAEYTEAGVATGHSIKTTAGASCLSFGVNSTGAIGCPVYNPYATATTTVGTSYEFPHNKIQTTYTATLIGQPYSFAFDSP